MFRENTGPQRGHGLLDVLVALAIAGLALGAAVPAVRSTLLTYRRSAAVQIVAAAIRHTQSVAVTRNGVYGFQWGGDPLVGRSKSEFRIVRDATGGCSFPATGASQDDVDVIRTWFDVAREHPKIVIESIKDNGGSDIGGVMFNYMGASVNSCSSVSFPVSVTISDGVDVRLIRINAAGTVSLP